MEIVQTMVSDGAGNALAVGDYVKYKGSHVGRIVRIVVEGKLNYIPTGPGKTAYPMPPKYKTGVYVYFEDGKSPVRVRNTARLLRHQMDALYKAEYGAVKMQEGGVVNVKVDKDSGQPVILAADKPLAPGQWVVSKIEP